MTPKKKAIEIFKKFYCMSNNSKSRIKCIEFDNAKKCALIVADEVLGHMGADRGYAFWTEVKDEIQKL